MHDLNQQHTQIALIANHTSNIIGISCANNTRIVVAYCLKDISYLSNLLRLGFKISVYTKPGPYCQNISQHANKNVLSHENFTIIEQKLNLGREASAYLEHIIRNYDNDNLDEFTIFIHDHRSGWHAYRHTNIDEFIVKNILQKKFNGVYKTLNSPNKKLPGITCCESQYYWFINHFILPYIPKRSDKDDCFSFGPWNSLSEYTCCAQFIVHKKYILQRPKIMYQDILDWIYTDPTIIEGGHETQHYLEQTWILFFVNVLLKKVDSNDTVTRQKICHMQKTKPNKKIHNYKNLFKGIHSYKKLKSINN